MDSPARFGLPHSAIQAIADIFSNHPKIDRAILYGSRAKGTHRAGSDIDLTLIAPTMELTKLLRIETEIDDLLLPYKADLSLLHQIENADLTGHIQRVGIDFFTRK